MSKNFPRSILLLAGSFTFVFLMGEAVHELGHYLAHLILGNTGIRIHLDPFGGSRILGVNPLIHNGMGFTSAAGPILNLLLGFAVSAVFWRIKNPSTLPFLFWGPTAAIQEGVNFTLGLLAPGGDASWMIEAGFPEAILLTLGSLLLLGGIAGVASLLQAAGLGADRRFSLRFLGLLLGIGLLMAIRSVFSAFLSRQAALENLLPLVFSLLVSTLIVAVQAFWAGKASRANHPGSADISGSALVLALSLGTGMFLLQALLP